MAGLYLGNTGLVIPDPNSTPVTAAGTVTGRTLSDRFAASISAKDCGAIADGTSHPLSEMIFVTGGVVSAIKVASTTVAAATGVTVPRYLRQAMTVTYSVAPTMVKSAQ